MKFVWPVPLVLFRALYFVHSIGRFLFPVAAFLFFMNRYACVWRDPISEVTRAEANPKVA